MSTWHAGKKDVPCCCTDGKHDAAHALTLEQLNGVCQRLDDAKELLETVAAYEPEATLGSIKVYIRDQRNWLQAHARSWLEGPTP